MLIKTVRVSDKGQIAIPLSVRKNAGIQRGDELVIIQNNGKILLEKAEIASMKIEDDFKDILKFSELALKEVWNNKEDDIWNSYLKK